MKFTLREVDDASRNIRRSILTATSLALGVAWFLAAVAARADAPPPIPVEAMRQDLAYLYENLQEAHYDLYVHRSKADYDAYYRKVVASMDGPLTRADAVRLVQRFAAYGKVGHARIDAGINEFMAYFKAGGVLLPLFVRVEAGRAYLLQSACLSGALPAGTEIVRVDGDPVLVWLDKVAEVVSAERPYMAYAQLEKMLPVAAWIALGERTSVRVTARDGAGRMFDTEVDALTSSQYQVLKERFPPPAPPTDFNSREVRILSSRIAYLRPGPFYNIEQSSVGPAPSYEDSAYRRFIDGAFDRIIAAGTRDLILDLRNNPGGDNSFSDPMVAWFANKPFRFASRFMLKASAATKAYYAKQKATGKEAASTDAILAKLMAAEAGQPNGARYPFDLPMAHPRQGRRYTGRVYVLVNRHSYSNATTTAALIQDYGFGKVVGEETADLPTTFGSVVYFDLPNTGITVTYPKSYIVRPGGNEELRGVVPDYRIADPLAPTREDVVLKKAVRLVKSLRVSGSVPK